MIAQPVGGDIRRRRQPLLELFQEQPLASQERPAPGGSLLGLALLGFSVTGLLQPAEIILAHKNAPPGCFRPRAAGQTRNRRGGTQWCAPPRRFTLQRAPRQSGLPLI